MESQSAHPVRANLLPTYYQLEIPTNDTNPKTLIFQPFWKKIRPKLWFPYTNPPRTCKEWQNELCPASIFHAGRCPSKIFWKIDQKRSFFNLFEKIFRHKLWFPYTNPPRAWQEWYNKLCPTSLFHAGSCPDKIFWKIDLFEKKFLPQVVIFFTLTNPGHGKNDKINFARHQFFILGGDRIRFFEKLTKNAHFSTFLTNFFASNCDFLTLTHPGHAKNDKTNFARLQFFMLGGDRIRFF